MIYSTIETMSEFTELEQKKSLYEHVERYFSLNL